MKRDYIASLLYHHIESFCSIFSLSILNQANLILRNDKESRVKNFCILQTKFLLKFRLTKYYIYALYKAKPKEVRSLIHVRNKNDQWATITTTTTGTTTKKEKRKRKKQAINNVD